MKHRPLCLEKNEWKAEPPLGAFVQHSQLWCEQSGLGRKRSTSRRWCSLNGIWEGTRMFMKSRKLCVDPAAVGSANFRQRTACFSRSEDDAHQSPEHWECTGNYRGRESSQCMRNAAKPPLTKPANACCVFFFSFLIILFRNISLITSYVKSSPSEKHFCHQVALSDETSPPLSLTHTWDFYQVWLPQLRFFFNYCVTNLPCGTTLGTAKQQLYVTGFRGPDPAALEAKRRVWEQTLASKSAERLRISTRRRLAALRILIHELHGFCISAHFT